MDRVFFRSCSNKAAVINVLLSAFSTLSSACRLLLGQKHLHSVYTAPAIMPIWFWSTVLLLTMKGNSFLALYLLLWSFLLCCSTVFLNNNQLFPYTMDNIRWQETWELNTSRISLLKKFKTVWGTTHLYSSPYICTFLSIIMILYSPQTA